MGADDYQVGGSHYKGVEMEHWTLVTATGMGYFEGQSTKYIMRWRKKNGVEDLQKALHYLDNLIENAGIYKGSRKHIDYDEVARIAFDCVVLTNRLSSDEGMLVASIASWANRDDLRAVRRKLQHFIEDVTNPPPEEETASDPVPLEDSNKHADRGES